MAATQTYLNPGPMPFLNIPRTFFEDRESRDLDCGKVVKRTQRHTHVYIGRDSLVDLLDDATYYAEMAGTSDGRENREMVAAAKRTLVSLARQIGISDDPKVESYIRNYRD